MTKQTEGPEKPNKIVFVFLVILILSLVLNFFWVVREQGRNLVVRVPDGDSIDLADGRRVRLLGVDAPEIGRCKAGEAKARLTGLVMDKRVRLKDTVRDSYGRILANVIIESWPETFGHIQEFFKRAFGLPHKTPLSKNMVNRAMVEEGLAKYSHAGTEYDGVLSDAGRVAQTGKIGIWSELCIQPIPTDPNCPIKGNIRNGKKTYHLPWCPNYDQTVINTAFGDQWFCSDFEAENAGFLQAEGCQ